MKLLNLFNQIDASSVHLLVVDDDPNIREFYIRLLRMNGYNVASAANGRDALEQIKASDFDLILTDDRMPEIDGLELIRQLRQHYPEIGIIMIASSASIDAIREAFKLRVYDYLIKPVLVEDLENTVRRAIGQQNSVKSTNTQQSSVYSCFISYSSFDEDFTKKLYSRLRDKQIRVWFAPEDIKGGRKINEQLDEAIQEYDKLVLILSEHSIQSEWVMTEIRKGRKLERKTGRRKLFPIRLVDMNILREWECLDVDTGRDLAVEVREYFIPDFSGWKDNNIFENAFARLLRDLQETEILLDTEQSLIIKSEVSTMPNQDDIKHQQELLSIHQRNLAHLVNQAAQHGGEPFAPPIIMNSIGEARDNIRRIKKVLRDYGVPVADGANEEPKEEQRSPVAPIGGTHITIHNGDYVAGEKKTGLDLRGQHVNYQYNAAGDIKFEAIENRIDLISELEKLKMEIGKAGEAQVIDAEIVEDTQIEISKAIREAKKLEPKKDTILERINGAKKLIEGVAAAGGMVTALIKAAELVQKFF